MTRKRYHISVGHLLAFLHSDKNWTEYRKVVVKHSELQRELSIQQAGYGFDNS